MKRTCGGTVTNIDRIEELYHSAGKLEPGERSAFLFEACGGDEELRCEVEALLSQPDFSLRLDAWTSDSTVLFETPSRQLAAGARLGHYRIEALLGAGGMGEVYRAVDTRLDRNVAIKISREQFSARFAREARAISSLNHPNICTLHDVGPNYLVMEMVDGETLRDWLKRAPPVDRSLEIARQVLEALRAAHGAGIVHRDLKPANVMVRFDGYVKVLDFGLAKRIPAAGALKTDDTVTAGLSVPGQIMGTVAYMSPEQVLGQEVDQRSDLFAFGIILYEMIAGRHPWPCTSTVDTMHAILHDDPPALRVASSTATELGDVVQRLLRKGRAERYPSAEAVLEALARAAPRDSSATIRLANSKPLTSIAVLPFIFLSEVDSRQGLSLGFADAVITILSNLDDVAVAPTSAILNYAYGTEAASVCRDLGVRYTLQGTVQHLGRRWRVSLQLFDSTTQTIGFSEKHDFEMEDVFDVQDEIGQRVVRSLESRFAPAVARSRDRYSQDAEAFDEFMSGLHDSYSNRLETLENAVRHLSRAIERDPEFALAHATLSYVSMNIHFQFDPQHTWLDKAEQHCERALALDRALPEGHLARSWILWSAAKNFQHADAIAALEQVLVAQPNSERAHNRMCSICLHIGRLPEARIAHERAQRSNPKTRNTNLDYYYLYTGNFARFEEQADGHMNETPVTMYALVGHALAPLYRGDLDLAGQRLSAALKQSPGEPIVHSLQAIVYAARNQTDLALECVRKALDSPSSFGHTHHAYHHIACAYAVLGDTDKALAWLQRSINTGFACWPFFRIDPYLKNLKEEPRFIQLNADLEQKYTALKIERP